MARLDAIECSVNLDEARRLTARLEILVAEFKVHHYSIIDLLDDDDDDLQRQQEVFEEHEDDVSQLTARLEKLVTVCSAKQSKITLKQVKVIEKGLANVLSGTSSLPAGDAGVCLLQQYDEQLSEFKSEFTKIRHSLFSLDLEDDSELSVLLTHIECSLFNCSLEVKKLVRTHSHSSSSSFNAVGVKLPKLEVPTFDGNILNWKTFREQFAVSVDGRLNLSDSEKLAYLCHAL